MTSKHHHAHHHHGNHETEQSKTNKSIFTFWSDTEDTYVGYIRVLVDLVAFILAFSMLCLAAFTDKPRVPVIFDAYYVYQPKPYDKIEKMFKEEIYGANTLSTWGATVALHAADMRTALDCTNDNATTGICGHCVDVYSAIIHDASTTKAGAFGAVGVETVLEPIKNNLIACAFREFGQFGVEKAFLVNPWLHLVVWNFFMLWQSFCVNFWKPGQTSTLFKTMTTGISFLLFLALSIGGVGYPYARINDDWEANTVRFDVASTLVLVILCITPPTLFWAVNHFGGGKFYDKKTYKGLESKDKETYDDNITMRVTFIDLSILLSTIPITTIVACFAGWLDHDLLSYLYTTVILLTALSGLDNFILLHIYPHSGESKSTHRDTLVIARMQIFFVALFTLVFMAFVFMPTSPAGDAFKFSPMIILFAVYLTANTFFIPIKSFRTNEPEDANDASTFKIIVDYALRISIMVYLYSIYADVY
jgi:hypothetical protein